MKTLNKDGEDFKYLHTIFISLPAKLKEGIFVEPDTGKIMKNGKKSS